MQEFASIWIVGLLFIGLGFLVVKYPMLISGYNTMTKEQRAKIDIRSFSLFMRNVMIAMGGIAIIGSICLYLAGLSKWKEILIMIDIFGGCGIMVWKGFHVSKGIQRSKTQKWLFGITIVFVLVVFISLVDTGRPAKVEVKEHTFIIHNAYGVKIPLDSITDVAIVDQLPTITMRTNGISFWRYHKGYYNTKEQGRIMLFFHSGQGPFLLVKSTLKPPIYINRSSPEEIESLYSQLKKGENGD